MKSRKSVKSRNPHEQNLQRNPEFVKRLVACFPDVITVHDLQGRYLYVSPRVEEVLGFTPEEYAGTTLEERKHPDDRAKATEFFRGLVSGAAHSGTLEYRTRHKDGSWRNFRASAGSLTDEKGKIIGVVASSRDITDVKRIEQQLLQAEKLGAIREMVSGVAHEMNNPLTAILGVTNLLRERTADSAAQRQLGMIEDQARKAAELVQGLLQIARPPRIKTEPVNLAEAVAKAIELKKGVFESAGVSVHCRGLENLPPVEGDAQQITHVFANLLSNAQQAISAVRASGRVEVAASQRGPSIEIFVDDDGPGIPEDLRSKIFDPFFTTRRAMGGTGLGLSICSVILREHQGAIQAQSSPEGGARFRLTLPAIQRDAPIAAAAAKTAIAGCSILLAEDEEGIREIIEESLRARGAKIESVRSGEEAWEKMRAAAYDICLCDFNMDGMNGLELFSKASQSLSNPPRFLFITGEMLDAPLIADLESKGARALQKPFQIADLAVALKEVLASSPAAKH